MLRGVAAGLNLEIPSGKCGGISLKNSLEGKQFNKICTTFFKEG